MTWYYYQFLAYCYGARGRSGKLGTYCVWGKHVSPTPVTQKHGHGFNIALLNRWLPAGKVERHGWIVCKRQATYPRIVLNLPGRGFEPRTSAPSYIPQPLRQTKLQPSNLPTGSRILNARKFSWAIGHPSSMFLRWILLLPRRKLKFEGQAVGWYLSQHAHLLLWEHWGIPCTHYCSPLHHQAEGAGRKVQEAWNGCCEAVRGIEESPRSRWVQGHCFIRCWHGGLQGGDWADPIDAPRIPEAACRGKCQDMRTTEEPPDRWSAVPIGSHLLQDARARLMGWSKLSSDHREASMHVDVLPRLSWAA